MIIRSESSTEYVDIFEVNYLAFGQENEARLVKSIRYLPNFNSALSLVAIESDRLVGHILFSEIAIASSQGEVTALALAPLAVLPQFQNQGVGSQLVRAGLKQCQILGYKIVIVLGHPNFYSRFGFVSAIDKGLRSPFSVPDEAFMVLELVPGALIGVSGMVKYSSLFDCV
ncbi:N-acetyltransferase [Chroococcidiopsis sp. FACHB-1243]|uniref:GNAT family N-acetyltransferase n=1 Tax=Chroococcidiopsis sp. [FACHB-1243] TaxID=2692781 RepID=UPI00177CD57C|nr:N-acetyltransferase [Chroococcidiopsis sp. [FACHB-1243]]MBD2309235.1 N-acetyltransferase [Chroococcidiopsis sp. [FACHB-1243]]